MAVNLIFSQVIRLDSYLKITDFSKTTCVPIIKFSYQALMVETEMALETSARSR
jgi:hypothetical protein